MLEVVEVHNLSTSGHENVDEGDEYNVCGVDGAMAQNHSHVAHNVGQVDSVKGDSCPVAGAGAGCAAASAYGIRRFGPTSEAFDRREVVVLTGETALHCKQMLLPIIRTDAGGFFGFGEHDSPKLDNFNGRFAQLLPPNSPKGRLLT